MLHLEPKSRTPLYQQIYEQIKHDILEGKLTMGTRLTSTRALAKELQIGRNTVENAYEQLVLEGYIMSVAGSGYVVNQVQFELNQKTDQRPPLSARLTGTPQTKTPLIQYNFQYGNMDTASFPSKLWRKCLTEVLEGREAQEIHSESDVKGDIGLRIQLVEYLYHSRGVNCSPEQLIICSGTQAALELILSLFPYLEKRVAMEDPCYNGASIVFQNNGFQISPIPNYEDGIGLKELSLSAAKMVYLNPSHQFPMGIIMPIQKRMEILSWAGKQDSLIIEDDYDSEFRYNGRPIPSLQSIDKYERVIYIGTFSKTLSPGLRMAYLVLPSWLLPAYQERFAGYQCTVPLIEQKILNKFMADGHWEKHLRKLCLAQKKKHDLLLEALTKNMKNKVRISGHQAGLHIFLEFLDGQQETELVQKALRHQVKVCPASPFWLNKEHYKNNALLLGYGMIPAKDIPPAVEILTQAWFG